MREEKNKTTRRGFLARAAAAMMALGAGAFSKTPLESAKRPSEKDLREADYYSRHDLAG